MSKVIEEVINNHDLHLGNMATTITITITITRVFYARYLHPAIAVMIMTTKRKRAVRRRLPSSSSPLYSSYMMYLVSMEMIMTTKRTVRTARTVMTTACVSQESWTAGSQCFSDSCLFDWGLLLFLYHVSIGCHWLIHDGTGSV